VKDDPGIGQKNRSFDKGRCEVVCLEMTNARRRRLAEWMLAALLAVLIVLNAPWARQLPGRVQNYAFVAYVVLLVFFVGLAWWRLVHLLRDRGAAKWRIGISIAGCVVFTSAFAVPFIALLPVSLGFDLLTLWLFSSLASLVTGFFAPGGMRFPLIIGGFAMSMLVVVIPKGVL
jgi:hypothetical protein